jgi:hypothetical protein
LDYKKVLFVDGKKLLAQATETRAPTTAGKVAHDFYLNTAFF